MSLYEGAVKKPIMTSLCFLAVVIFGLFSLSKLPIDLYPDIDTNTIMVMTAYPGASALDIENNVTRPLENVLNSVSDLKHITSRSSENMSLITLEFEFGNDIDVLTNDVRDKLDMVSSELPDDVENPIIFKFSTDMIPIVLLSVQANESQSALYKILDDRVVNPLARIPGVGTVSISGAPQREIQVYCDPYKLEAYNLSIHNDAQLHIARQILLQTGQRLLYFPGNLHRIGARLFLNHNHRTLHAVVIGFLRTFLHGIHNPGYVAQVNGSTVIGAHHHIRQFTGIVKLTLHTQGISLIADVEITARYVLVLRTDNGTDCFDIGSETYALRVEGEFDDSRQLADVVVGTHNGANVFLRDVARIVDTVEERAQETYNNGVQGAMIVVQKQSGANSVEISKKVADALPRLQKNLPSDVKIGVIVDTSDNILNTIDSLTETVVYALLFVVIVVFLFLGRWRATLIICITIPLSLIASFIYLAVSGNTINIISLSSLSIAIGMVVDDAIVVLENVTTHIERGSDPKQAAVHGTNEVAISVIASTLTMIAVFFPLTMVSGMSGVLFKQLGWMMCAIMFISTVAALSLTPMLCSQLLRLQKKPSKMFKLFFTPIEKALDGLDTWYAKMLNWAVRHRPIVIVGCIAFFVISLMCAKGIGTEFFPAQDNARIAVKLELPIGTRKEIAQELSEKLTNQWLTKYKDIMKVCNYTVGQADSDNTWASMQDNGSHIISFNISLVDPGDRDITLEAVCDEMREDLKAYPEFSKAQVILGGSNTGMSAQASADFEVYGYDMTVTDSVAARLKRELLKVKGVTEVNISRSDYQPEYQVDFDREKLAMHGLNLSTAGNYLRNRVNGAVASKYREDGDEYDIKVRYAPEFRTSLESLENILIYNAQGQSVRVKDVGKVVERFAPPTIERKDRERIVTVSAVISGAPLGDVVAAGNKVIDKMDLPGEVTIQISCSYEDQQDSFRDLVTLGILIVILVFIVMAAQFESLTYPFIIMFSLPFAFSGVLMALFFTGSTLSVISTGRRRLLPAVTTEFRTASPRSRQRVM